MMKWDLRYHSHRRRSLDASYLGPILRLGSVILLGLGLIVLVWSLFQEPEQEEHIVAAASFTPAPTEAPTPTPQPVVRLTGSTTTLDLAPIGNLLPQESFLAPNRLLFTVGYDAHRPNRIYAYGYEDGVLRRVGVATSRGTLRYPIETDGDLLYVDTGEEGGGIYRNTASGAERLLGLPAGATPLHASNGYLAYRSRTAEDAVSLYLVELATGRGITLARFKGSLYGSSEPHLTADTLCYAVHGGLLRVNLTTGAKERIETEGLVHDPRCGTGFIAYLTAPHGQDAALVVRMDDGTDSILAENVTDFAVTEDFVLYEKEGTVYAAIPKQSVCFPLTKESASLLSAGEGRVFYREGETYRLTELEYRIDGEG